MLFFFELFLFVLLMMTLALGEFVGRGLALILWLVVTAFAVVGYLLALRMLRPYLARAGGQTSERIGLLETGLPEREERQEGGSSLAGGGSETSVPTPLDEKWARTLLYNWRRSNVLLLLGALAVAGWYWLGG